MASVVFYPSDSVDTVDSDPPTHPFIPLPLTSSPVSSVADSDTQTSSFQLEMVRVIDLCHEAVGLGQSLRRVPSRMVDILGVPCKGASFFIHRIDLV